MTKSITCAPVLFLVFNRPECTHQVFQAIRAARPSRLFVAADGPRPERSGEAERCRHVRAIATAVDWPCDVQTLFRDHNLGCGRAVSEAISWFFGQVAEGIVLEDDCLPDQSFFAYASALLERFREDSRIGQVCGYNLLPHQSPPESDYFLSHFGWSWGWASWRRAWRNFDLTMASWPNLKASGQHLQYPFYRERVRIFDQTYSGAIDTWDYQWHYALSAQGQWSLIPCRNLIENIGFGSDATHTNATDASRAMAAESLPSFEFLRHPSLLLPNPAYERALIRAAHPPFWVEWPIKISAKISRLKERFQ
jgi:hypothetical protein